MSELSRQGIFSADPSVSQFSSMQSADPFTQFSADASVFMDDAKYKIENKIYPGL